jgi:ectoine hydroxylase-related dioxygenase (phytanoyl-CoA dioxygenase family)
MAVTSVGERALGADQVERFERDGFLVVEGTCPAQLIEGVQAEIDPLLHDRWSDAMEAERDGLMYTSYGGWPEHDLAWHRILNAWKTCDSVRALALSEPLLKIVEQLYGRTVKPFQTLNFPIGTQQPAHADSFHFQSDPPGLMCGIWVALEDMDMDNGPLVYYPGSHKLPMPTWQVIEQATGYSVSPDEFETHQDFLHRRHEQYAEYCRWLIEHEGLEPQYGTIRKGQALIWAANLLHGGSPQTDRDRTRNSQVTHYFFEDARVYTPMHVEDGHVYWDYPAWISDPVPQYSAAAVADVVSRQVPAGARVVVVAHGGEEPVELDGYATEPFPQAENGTRAPDVDDAGSTAMLEALRERGARFLVVPKPSLVWLEWAKPSLQELLETRYRAIFADGSTCVIYSLE